MAIGVSDSKHYTDIAAAIRERNGTETTYKPSEMAAAIKALKAIEGGVAVSSLNIYEHIGMFTVTYMDGTVISGNATFDENGVPISLEAGNGTTVNFMAGYPISARDKDGNSVSVVWG